MDLKFLDFEQPIAELEAKIDELRFVGDDSEININEEVARLKSKSEALTKSIFSKLGAWQIAQIARHPMRPYTADYLGLIAPDFQELHGDRMYADDPAIIGGVGRVDGRPIMFIGHQKGRDTKERVRRNYGMPKPEGYRKAQRLMKMAEKFSMPIVTLIDTPGAYPGVGAEERGQSQAIAQSLYVMAKLKTPIVSVVIGGRARKRRKKQPRRCGLLQRASMASVWSTRCCRNLWGPHIAIRQRPQMSFATHC
jgi:acetyl-CoA carboxylase carboxyl transferase subunit alpha